MYSTNWNKSEQLNYFRSICPNNWPVNITWNGLRRNVFREQRFENFLGGYALETPNQLMPLVLRKSLPIIWNKSQARPTEKLPWFAEIPASLLNTVKIFFTDDYTWQPGKQNSCTFSAFCKQDGGGLKLGSYNTRLKEDILANQASSAIS